MMSGKPHQKHRIAREASKMSTTSKGSMGSIFSHFTALSDRFRRMSSTSSGLGTDLDPSLRSRRREAWSQVHFNKAKVFKHVTSAMDQRDSQHLENILHGIDLSELEDSDTSIFTYRACASEDLELLTVLLRHGAAVNAVGENGKCPLHICVIKKSCALVALLLGNGANPNFTSWYEGKTPLHYATLQSAEDIMELLLNNGALPNNKDIYGQTPMHIACRLGNKNTLKILLDHRADINEKDNEGWTALHLAASVGNSEMVHFLAKQKAHLNSQTRYGRTALHWACDEGQFEAVHELLVLGANANISDLHERIPLAYCKGEALNSLVDVYTAKPDVRNRFASALDLNIEPKRKVSIIYDEHDGPLFAIPVTLDTSRKLSMMDMDDVMDELETARMAPRSRIRSNFLSRSDILDFSGIFGSQSKQPTIVTPDVLRASIFELVQFVVEKAEDTVKAVENYVQIMTALCNTGLQLQASTLLQHIPTLQAASKTLQTQTRGIQGKERSLSAMLERLQMPKEGEGHAESTEGFQYAVLVFVFMNIVEAYISRQENGWREFANNLNMPRDVQQLLTFRLQIQSSSSSETCKQILIQWARLHMEGRNNSGQDFIHKVHRVLLKCDFSDAKLERSSTIFRELIQTYFDFKTETAVDERSQNVGDLLQSLTSNEKTSLQQLLKQSPNEEFDSLLSTTSKENTKQNEEDKAVTKDANNDVSHLTGLLKDMLEEREEEQVVLVVKFLVNSDKEELLLKLL